MGNFADGKTCTSWKTSERKKDANEQAELSLHHFKAQLGHCGFLRKVCSSSYDSDFDSFNENSLNKYQKTFLGGL